MGFLTVENWDKYQHYKAERPAWIKWYREVTNDLDWLAMSDEGKLLFPYILLVAAETANQIPADVDVLSLRLRLKRSIVRKGIDSLTNSGFLHFMHEDEEHASTCTSRARTRSVSVSPSVSVSQGGGVEGVEIPDALDTQVFRAAWSEWLDYRRRDKRKAVTKRAAEMQLKKLAKSGPAVAVEAIEQAIANDWQGVFPDKIETKRPTQSRKGPPQPVVSCDDCPWSGPADMLETHREVVHQRDRRVS